MLKFAGASIGYTLTTTKLCSSTSAGMLQASSCCVPDAEEVSWPSALCVAGSSASLLGLLTANDENLFCLSAKSVIMADFICRGLRAWLVDLDFGSGAICLNINKSVVVVELHGSLLGGSCGNSLTEGNGVGRSDTAEGRNMSSEKTSELNG